MSKEKYFGRYKNIIHRLERSPATYEEIKAHLDRCSEIEDVNYEISQRTLQRDIKDIYRHLNIEIQNEKRGLKRYYIESKPEDHNASMQLLNYFELFSAAQAGKKFNTIVFMEARRPLGMQHFAGLLHAIQNQHVVRFQHHRFEDDQLRQREVQPLALKEARGRWYLVTQDPEKGFIKTYGLDRISDLEILKQKFRKNGSLNLEAHFEPCLGVLHSQQGPQKLKLKFTWEQGQYILTYPIHASQQLVKETSDWMVFEYRINLTYDLRQEILSYGDTVEVLAPASFRKELKAVLEQTVQKYR